MVGRLLPARITAPGKMRPRCVWAGFAGRFASFLLSVGSKPTEAFCHAPKRLFDAGSEGRGRLEEPAPLDQVVLKQPGQVS